MLINFYKLDVYKCITSDLNYTGKTVKKVKLVSEVI